MRVKPRPSLAWIIAIGYVFLFLVLEKIMGIGYDEIGATPTTSSVASSSRSPSAPSCSPS